MFTLAKRKVYPKEFRLQAARMVVERGFSQAKVGRELGVSSWSIRKWIQQFRKSGELSEDGKVLEEAKELKQLQP